MPVDPITVEFVGPFSWPGDDEIPSIHEADVGDRFGVYLWTVPYQQQELIYYVGETGTSFSVRMAQHFEKHTSGAYHLYEPREFSRGRKVALWHGMYGPDRELSLLGFIRRLPELAPVIQTMRSLIASAFQLRVSRTSSARARIALRRSPSNRSHVL